MSTVQAVPLITADLDRSAVIRTIDAISASAGFIAAIALAVMTVIVGYEVVSRSVFNAPTTWVTEISTYIFVGIVFLGLAERRGAAGDLANVYRAVRLGRQPAQAGRRRFHRRRNPLLLPSVGAVGRVAG